MIVIMARHWTSEKTVRGLLHLWMWLNIVYGFSPTVIRSLQYVHSLTLFAFQKDWDYFRVRHEVRAARYSTFLTIRNESNSGLPSPYCCVFPQARLGEQQLADDSVQG